MELISTIFGPIFLVLVLLVFFGMIAGVKADRLVSTYLNLVVQLFVVIGEILIKIAIPVLKQLGERIVYTANHYLAEQKKHEPQIGQTNTAAPNVAPGNSNVEETQEQMPKDENSDQPKAKSANPYDDPPEPEIMD